MLYLKILQNFTPTFLDEYFFFYLRSTFFLTVFLNVILGFCCEVDENCVLLGFYAASSGNFLATCQDNLSSVRNYHYSLRNNPEERNSHLRIPLFCYMTPNFETIMCLWRVGVRLSIGDATSDYPLSDYPLTTQRQIIHWRRNVRLSIIRLSIDDATSDYPLSDYPLTTQRHIIHYPIVHWWRSVRLSIDDATSDYPLSDYPLTTQRQIIHYPLTM